MLEERFASLKIKSRRPTVRASFGGRSLRILCFLNVHVFVHVITNLWDCYQKRKKGLEVLKLDSGINVPLERLYTKDTNSNTK